MDMLSLQLRDISETGGTTDVEDLQKQLEDMRRKKKVTSNHTVANELVKVAKLLSGMEFDTQKELEDYKKTHKVRPDTELKVKKDTSSNKQSPTRKTPKQFRQWKDMGEEHRKKYPDWKKDSHPIELHYNEALHLSLSKRKDMSDGGKVVYEIERGNPIYMGVHSSAPISEQAFKDIKEDPINGVAKHFGVDKARDIFESVISRNKSLQGIL